jgi:hypothetical protein
VTEEEIYVVLGLFLLTGIIQKNRSEIVFHHKRGNFHTRVWRHYKRQNEICEISSSHGGKYETQNLLGCTAVVLIE